MNATTPIGELAQALAEGLSQPRHAWEAAALLLALGGGWLLARVAGTLVQRHRAAQPLPESLAALRRLFFPVFVLGLLWIGEGMLRRAHVLAGPADARLMHLAMFLVGALAVVRVLLFWLRRVFRGSGSTIAIGRAISVLALVGVLLYATGAWDDVLDWLAATQIPLGNAAKVSLLSILVGGITTLVSLLAAMWLGSIVDERLAAQPALDPNLRIVLARAARALLLVFALLLALALSGIDLTVLSVFGGALGVGLGLGLQRIASNYVSGFILLLDRSLRIGDVVQVDRYYGQVSQINTRYTVLRASDGTDAIVPNEMLVSSPVVNYTFGDRRIVLGVTVSVGLEADLARAQELMRAAAQATARVLADPPPSTMLKEFAHGNVVLEVDFSIGDPEKGRQNVQSDVALAIVARFRAAGIELAVPRGAFVLPGQPGEAGGAHAG